MDKVTIGIPSYNYAKYLPQAIDSCLSQTYPNVEIIVIDDSSTDETAGLINHYQQKYPHIKYIRHEVNQGLSASRNTGLKAGTGDWFMFLDADDWIDKDLVDLSIQWAQTKNADIIGVWQQEFGDRGEVHHFHPN